MCCSSMQLTTILNNISRQFILTNKSIHEKTKISLDLGKKGYIISEKYVLDKSGTKIKAEEPNATNKKTKIIFELEPMTVNHFVIE